MGRQQAPKQPTFPLWHPPQEALYKPRQPDIKLRSIRLWKSPMPIEQPRSRPNSMRWRCRSLQRGCKETCEPKEPWRKLGWGGGMPSHRALPGTVEAGEAAGGRSTEASQELMQATMSMASSQAVAATGPVLTSTQEHVLHKSATGLRALASTVFPAAYQCGSHSWNHRSESSRESHLAHTISDAADVAMEPVKNSTTGFLFGRGLWQTGCWHPRPLRWRHHGWPTATGLTQERATRPAQTTRSSFPRPARTSPSRSRHGKRLWHMLPRLEDPQWAR